MVAKKHSYLLAPRSATHNNPSFPRGCGKFERATARNHLLLLRFDGQPAVWVPACAGMTMCVAVAGSLNAPQPAITLHFNVYTANRPFGFPPARERRCVWWRGALAALRQRFHHAPTLHAVLQPATPKKIVIPA